MYFHNDYSMNEKIVFKIIVKEGVFNNDRFYIFLTKTSKIKVVSENIFLVDYT